MSFFDTSHLVGLEGSAGPPVSHSELFNQSVKQQFRVDSARALDEELRNRWLESLRAAQITDQINVAPDPLGRNPQVDPDDPWAYRAFAQHVSGQPIDTFDPNKTLGGYDPTARLKGMIDANEKIKQLNNPNIKTFEQILEEVAQMQHEVEGETASMYERSGTGGFAVSLLGAIVGSFTTRDPLNLITAPIGAGRTVATRIASEMGLAAAVVGYTEVAEVAPARQIAGLPERNPLFNIAAATIGAGIIRGGIEGIGYGVRHLRSEDINFDLRDSQLAQMFEANVDKPSARAGLAILDDVKFIERNNPYGEGYQANTRFLAELQAVQRAMNGEPMTAVARVLPPIPYESLKKAADFEIVREQAPQVYAKMEAAQARLSEFQINKVTDSNIVGDLPDRGVAPAFLGNDGRIYVGKVGEQHFSGVSQELRDSGVAGTGFVNAEGKYLDRVEALKYVNDNGERIRPNENMLGELDALDYRDQSLNVPPVMSSLSRKAWEEANPWWTGERFYTKRSTMRRAANKKYRAAYREVEVEATRLREQQAKVEAAQQADASAILVSQGLPFIGPLLRRDSVEELVDRINTFNDGLDERTAARFVRESVGEGEDKIEVEVWEKDGGIDIGLRDPVDPNFTFMTDEGEMTVAAAMRDLQDDTDLVEAIKGCAI